MNELSTDRQRRWQRLVAQVEREYRALGAAERDWIAARLQQIADLQSQLQQLFRYGGGEQACGLCSGDCCAKGHNHMTLVNLLGYLQQGQLPPQTDFAATCPYLGPRGCRLSVERRPYNCISFICDKIENRLAAAEVERYYQLEQRLRRLYQEFAERYAGGALTGLLLQEQRLGGRGFLRRKSKPASEQ